jgi:mannitol/fructose-specific phosphotransferase system IIA component (Ntr-type)
VPCRVTRAGEEAAAAALRDSDPNSSRIQMLAKLVRKLMNEPFRQHFMKLDDPQSTFRY